MPDKVVADRMGRLGLDEDLRQAELGRLRRDEIHTRAVQSPESEPSYYSISPLKPSVWKWQIASYFFLGGLSAGAYILARIAERFGGRQYRHVTQVGTVISSITGLACPPLLIWDLGDPKRFHHMLRVCKPSTPMNLGSWTLVLYNATTAAAVIREYLNAHPDRRTGQWINSPTLVAIHDAAGVPVALMLAGYTGVLLSCTANPLWCKNPWLGPYFSCAAISCGAEAITLTLNLTDRGNEDAQRLLGYVDSAAHIAEYVCDKGFLHWAGEKAHTLNTGREHQAHRFADITLFVSELLKYVPAPPPAKRIFRMLSAICGLSGSYALRWCMTYGGQAAAGNPHTARLVSRPQAALPGQPAKVETLGTTRMTGALQGA